MNPFRHATYTCSYRQSLESKIKKKIKHFPFGGKYIFFSKQPYCNIIRIFQKRKTNPKYLLEVTYIHPEQNILNNTGGNIESGELYEASKNNTFRDNEQSSTEGQKEEAIDKKRDRKMRL